MSGVMEYKCPCCGGYLEFNATSQNIKCPYCETEFDISQFADETAKAGTQNTQENGWQEDELKGMYVYECKSCSGEIIGDETLGATRCPYCGNSVVMKEQFSGDLRPDLIIPFCIDEKQAKENKSANGGNKKSESEKSTTPIKPKEKIDVRSKLASDAGVSLAVWASSPLVIGSSRLGNTDLSTSQYWRSFTFNPKMSSLL